MSKKLVTENKRPACPCAGNLEVKNEFYSLDCVQRVPWSVSIGRVCSTRFRATVYEEQPCMCALLSCFDAMSFAMNAGAELQPEEIVRLGVRAVRRDRVLRHLNFHVRF